MIKINLLNSVTDRHNDTVNVVERKVANPNLRLWLMGFAVTALLFVAVGYDVFSTRAAKAAAETELENKRQVAAQLESVMKEQKELEAKIENIKSRIEAIKALRATQAGPSAVLNALTERIASTPGVYLISIEQKGDLLTIKGTSPDEKQVTDFGRSLEFSSGLFSNLNIETQMNEIQLTNASDSGANAPKISTVNFTIRCAYTPSKASSDSGVTTAAVAQPAAASPAAAPAQVAQK
jgi:Tfp pilus assembly protein PilN